MDYSDDDNWSDDEVTDDILGPEDLFNDEADENVKGQNDYEEAKEKPEKSEKNLKEKVDKKLKQPRLIKNSRVTLNFDTLKGKGGLSALKKMFKNFKFKGNGHEKEDLTKILGVLQHWMCYQLCPSYDFESCMLQLEVLGKKKVVQTLMKKYRLGMDDWGENKFDEVENVIADASLDISGNTSKNEFDLLMHEEIANIGSDEELGEVIQTQNETQLNMNKEAEISLTPEQLERIARNKRLAEEKRLKRLAGHVELEVNLQPKKMNLQEISDRINLEEDS